MKILFLRESEGVYQFGQKRIHVRVEKGGQVLIRVGGGFMTAAEFIETYTPAEVNKIQRQDASKRFAQKIRTQRLSRDLSQSSLEKTPIEFSQVPASMYQSRDGNKVSRFKTLPSFSPTKQHLRTRSRVKTNRTQSSIFKDE